MSSELRFWPRRLRWRLVGAWQWPALVVFTVADTLVLHALPPREAGVEVIPAFVFAGFVNLFLVGALAPRVGRRLARRGAGRRTSPEIVVDRAATTLLALGVLVFVVAGLAARPGVASKAEAARANIQMVHDYVVDHGRPEHRRNLARADTVTLDEGYFRTCVPEPDPARAFCMYVDTGSEPPKVTPDPNPVPNERFLGIRSP